MVSPRTYALLILAVAGLADGVITDLKGAHYNITVVHDPPGIDVGLNDGVILDSSEWTGSVGRLTTASNIGRLGRFIIDMIGLISTSAHANFSYTLALPTGAGAKCSGNQSNAMPIGSGRSTHCLGH